jgi:hypothetical protein
MGAVRLDPACVLLNLVNEGKPEQCDARDARPSLIVVGAALHEVRTTCWAGFRVLRWVGFCGVPLVSASSAEILRRLNLEIAGRLQTSRSDPKPSGRPALGREHGAGHLIV